MSAGRPLRFLLLVAGGWIGARAVMLWPTESVDLVEEIVLPKVGAVTPAPIPALPNAMPEPRWAVVIATARFPPRAPSPPGRSPAPMMPPTAEVHVASDPIIAGLPQPLPAIHPDRRSRFGGSAWIVFRGGSGTAAGGLSPQLGGSQAGARLTYAVTGDRRLALAARIASPLGPGMREAALGLEWQPTRWPVRIVAEQRFALDQGRGGPTLALVGGAGPLPLAAGFALEGYGQGGVIGRNGGEAFVDGAARLARPVGTIGTVKFDLGMAGWGAAQRGATRLDIGPSLGARLPLAGQSVRLSLDWRQRIAGNARPDSGIVLTLGTDF